VWSPPRERPELDYRAAGITSIVWCIGFRTDYSWIDLPVFNGRGHPSHVRGVNAGSRRVFPRPAVTLHLGLGPVLGRGEGCGIFDRAHQGSALARAGRPASDPQRSSNRVLTGPRSARYLILDSRNSTCFFATGSYFFMTNLSVMVREFLRVT
jgi:hypothetical protein